MSFHDRPAKNKVLVTTTCDGHTNKAKISIPKNGLIYIRGNQGSQGVSNPLGYYGEPPVWTICGFEKSFQVTLSGIHYERDAMYSQDMRILLILIRNHLGGTRYASLKGVMKFIWLHIKRNPLENYPTIPIANVRQQAIFDPYAPGFVDPQGQRWTGEWIEDVYCRTLKIADKDVTIKISRI
jgi:hypothetical protein